MSIFIIKQYQEGCPEKIIKASGNKRNIFSQWELMSNQMTNQSNDNIQLSDIHFRYKLGFIDESIYALEEIKLID